MKDVFNPLEQLSDASKTIAGGDYDVQITYDGHIEEIQNTIDIFISWLMN